MRRQLVTVSPCFLFPFLKLIIIFLQEEHRQDMEAELAERTLLGVAAIRELGGSLAVAVETQRALADEVGPHVPPAPPPANRIVTPPSPHRHSVPAPFRWRP